MKYLSVCDGIGAAHVAWKPMGWTCAGASEIERFPIAVVKERHPEIPELGDMTKYHEWNIERPDLVCGGTPCQSFSVAGLRKGMADPRGNPALTFLALVDHFRPKWVVWENVPGVLSSGQGRDFGAFLGGLGQLGYGFAYRVLDAQYFGLAQRRKRVFVVGCLGDWRGAAAVLFERESLRWHLAPSRGKGKGVAATVSASAPSRRNGGSDPTAGHFVTHTLKGEGFDASEDGTGRGVPLVMAHGQANAEIVSDGEPSLTCNHEAPILMRMREGKEGGGKGPLVSKDQSLTLATANDQVLAFSNRGIEGESFETLRAQSHGALPMASTGMQVRRLTPRECARLQGFPDDYLDITYRGKPAADGPKYKALGNSWAVPCARWIGERIKAIRP